MASLLADDKAIRYTKPLQRKQRSCSSMKRSLSTAPSAFGIRTVWWKQAYAGPSIERGGRRRIGTGLSRRWTLASHARLLASDSSPWIQSVFTKTDARIVGVKPRRLKRKRQYLYLGLLNSNHLCGFISDDLPNIGFPVKGFRYYYSHLF